MIKEMNVQLNRQGLNYADLGSFQQQKRDIGDFPTASFKNKCPTSVRNLSVKFFLI
jgi:hypothetical protein